ncbi:hypothetical protein BDA96_06G267600 [Sorghum bicolor]|jgi:hypothetical protein|uniref:KIB1-4 beta-propeller domain-containing protein n=2 Tax=Sorghum bicolor TaxID=4558 RepID=A0A921QTT8_SORBI|nr:uncharacterized protein LOC8068495 [Sorghum bicolor]EES11560.1 hypothetical protein SORBI_3006G244200 [Sorghum bicolor]KAG0527837.1 hypothetical protein BDA96_06G267600 [Sorghum bicolor]|eukprot:XP_002447232.1 uncharacterized protein LOC8068495 [Sorghum bicolor]
MSSGSNDADTAPWADLPPDLCNVVVDHLDVVGVIRFPAVCTDWAAASNNTHCPRLPSGTPTLLTSSLDPEGYDIEYDVEPGTFGLHDVVTGKSYHGEAEGLKKRTWIGGKDDWLVTTDLRCNVELLNPITGARVRLPSFATIPDIQVMEVHDRGPGVSFEKTLHRFRKVGSYSLSWTPTHRFHKVALCRTPAHPSGYLAVALFFSSSGDDTGLVAFTAAHDERWTPLNNPPPELHSRDKYTDVIVHKGKVLAVATSGKICSWDMDDDTTVEPKILPPPDVDIDVDYYVKRVFYLATSSGGDLQLICLFGDSKDIKETRWWRIVFDFQWCFWPRRVLLHELNAVTDTWRRVGDLGGDRALFVGNNYPFYIDVPRDGSKDPFLQADCVYVADLMNCDAGIFDLKLGDDFEFEFNWNAHLCYPTLRDPLQIPMWFQPTTALPKSTSAHSVEERQTLLL